VADRDVGQNRSEPRRAEVRHDKFAIFDLGRDHGLDDRARWMLVVLCQLAEYETRRLSITVMALSEYTGTSRTTVPKVLHKLKDAGLIAITKPFGGNRAGEVEVLAWDQLIVGSTHRHRFRPGRQTSDRPNAQPSVDDDESFANHARSIREANADFYANDQGKAPLLRQQGRRKYERDPRATVAEQADFKIEVPPPQRPFLEAFRTEPYTGRPPAPDEHPYFWDLPLGTVGVCQHCGTTTVMRDALGPVCKGCRAKSWAELERRRNETLS
jgi:hypothetical protein